MRITAKQMKEVQLGFFKNDVDTLVEKILEKCTCEAKLGKSYLYLGKDIFDNINLNVLKGAQKEMEGLGYGCSLTRGSETVCW